MEIAKEKGYAQLKSRHIQDYQTLFQRVQLDLGADVDASTTDDLLKKYKPQEGAGFGGVVLPVWTVFID